MKESNFDLNDRVSMKNYSDESNSDEENQNIMNRSFKEILEQRPTD
jgi:uncharacterized membrane protein